MVFVFRRFGLPLVLLTASLMFSGCVPPPPPKDYAAFDRERPRSILIVPVTNRSTEVDAPDGLLVTLPVPVAERGFYVFPTHMVRRTMEDDGLGDADLVQRADPVRLAELFGADAVLYATIQEWNAQYVLLSTQTTVAIDYVLKSGKTGETLWSDSQRQVLQVGSQGTDAASLIAGAIVAAIERAAPTYLPLARQASHEAVSTDGRGIPFGPYYERQR